MPPRFKDIGDRLKAYRLGAQLTADDVGKKLGLSRAAVYRIEAGDVVKIETLEACRHPRRFDGLAARRCHGVL